MPRLFSAALFTVVEVWKLPKCLLIGEWISKLWHILTVLQKEGVLYILIPKCSKIHCKVKNPEPRMMDAV